MAATKTPAPAKVDALAIARRAVIEPYSIHNISTLGIAAVCEALVVAHAELTRSAIPAELAEAARALIAAEAEHSAAKGADGYAPLKIGLAREAAFHTFRTLFEEEFPQ